MTRVQIAIVTPAGKIMTSIEFNGDMYYEDHGKDVFDALECVETVEDYEELVTRFNNKNYSYDEELFYDMPQDYFNMQDDYFEKWFSDYVYIKNLSEKPVVFTDCYGKKIKLVTETTAVFNFGEFIACSADDFKARAFIDKLNVKKENLSYDTERNYAEIWNMCADYDNNHRGGYLTDRITECDFVTEEVLEYIVKEKSTDLCSLRSFINDTYNANIYKLDGYGNLANVENSDFEDLIDDLVYELEHGISVPIAKQEACL